MDASQVRSLILISVVINGALTGSSLTGSGFPYCGYWGLGLPRIFFFCHGFTRINTDCFKRLKTVSRKGAKALILKDCSFRVHDPGLMGLNRVMSPRKSPFCLHHSYKFFIINDRLSLQGGGTIPDSFVSIEQSMTELNGLLAGVGYSLVVMGSTFFITNESYCPASSNIFSAKACHVVSPAPQKW